MRNASGRRHLHFTFYTLHFTLDLAETRAVSYFKLVDPMVFQWKINAGKEVGLLKLQKIHQYKISNYVM